MKIMNNSSQVLCFGEVLWDNLPTGALPGGAPMNVAIHLNRFGISSVIASSIGNDPKGKGLVSYLEQQGMDTRHIQVHPALPTSEVLVKLDEHNTATFEICEPVAWDGIALTPSLQDERSRSGILVYGSLASRNTTTRDTLLQLLSNDGLLRIMDVNLRPPFDRQEVVEPLLRKADIVKLNDEELEKISGWFGLKGNLEAKARQFFDFLNLQILLVTKGAEGAMLINQDEIISHPGIRVSVADTVGAGDAFLAGYLAAAMAGKSNRVALDDASTIGAFVASKPGAVPEYDEELLQEFKASVTAN